jgi:hypothetical protein
MSGPSEARGDSPEAQSAWNSEASDARKTMTGPSEARGDSPQVQSARNSEARDARKTMTGPALTAAFAVLVAALVGGLAAGGGCGSSSHAPDRPGQAAHPDDSCINDHDCTFVDDCCNCNAGGRRIAIRVDALVDFTASQAQRCTDVVCTQMMSNDVSCRGPAICGNLGHCRPAAGNPLP